MNRKARGGVTRAVLVVGVAFLMACLPTVALADHSVNDVDNSNHLYINITKNGNVFTCTGTNVHASGNEVAFILVSAVCQWKGGGVWHDFEGAPANSNSPDSSVSITYVDNPCTGNDGGVNLQSGTYPIRGQVDGRWENYAGTSFPYNNDPVHGDALETTSPFYNASCSA